MSSSGKFTVDIQIPNAELWDVFQPNLYDAHVTLLNGDDVVDTYKQRFGIRTIRRDRESTPPERQARLPPGLRAPRGLPDHRKGVCVTRRTSATTSY